jgi:hypothetical protein
MRLLPARIPGPARGGDSLRRRRRGYRMLTHGDSDLSVNRCGVLVFSISPRRSDPSRYLRRRAGRRPGAFRSRGAEMRLLPDDNASSYPWPGARRRFAPPEEARAFTEVASRDEVLHIHSQCGVETLRCASRRGSTRIPHLRFIVVLEFGIDSEYSGRLAG